YWHTHGGRALVAAVSALVVLGLIVRLRTRPSVFEVFTVGYLALLLIYPVSLEPDRYSMPLWPLLLLYALAGCLFLGSYLKGYLRYAPATALCAVLVVDCFFTYRVAIHRWEQPLAATAMHGQELFRAIREQLPGNAVVLAAKPSVIALFTDRH